MNALQHTRGSPIVALDGGGPFNTIATGASGSGRLIDMSAAQLAAMRRGALAWVESVKDFWRWDPTSTATADNITVCNPTVNIGNNGRLVRCLVPAPEWMTQTTWVVDEANSTGLASDENTGGSGSVPLLTDLERQRRMGPWPEWTQTEYHLRYISDAATPVEIKGSWTNLTGNIYIHGSLTNGQGKAVLKTLAVDAIVAQDRTTNAPLKFTSNGLTTSWTADGTLNNRCRMTSGAGNGGYVWPMLDLGTKQAMMSETLVVSAANFTNPLSQPFSSFTPALNDTFVVESLSSINLSVNMNAYGQGLTNALVVESLSLAGYAHQGTTQVNLIGCIWGAAGSPTNFCKALTICGCRFKPTSLVAAEQFTLFACYWDDSASGRGVLRQGNSASGVLQCITVQRQGIRYVSVTKTSNAASGGSLTARFTTSIGIFNNSAGAGVSITGTVGFDNTLRVWGVCGAGGTPVCLDAPGSRLTWVGALPGPANFYTIDVTAAPGACWISYRADNSTMKTTAPAFDPATSTFTAYRNLTPANLQAAIGSGGFNGQWFDPMSTSAMVSG